MSRSLTALIIVLAALVNLFLVWPLYFQGLHYLIHN